VDPIKPSQGDNIVIGPSEDKNAAKAGGGCC
jgi:hypothetical protein